MSLLIFFISLILLPHTKFSSGQNDCRPTRCIPSGPEIRFPFRLKNQHAHHCVYNHNFDLYCDRENNTVFEFQYPILATARKIIIPVSVTVNVSSIDYKNQVISVNLFNGSCLPDRVPQVNSSTFFQLPEYGQSYVSRYTLFNCSDKTNDETQYYLYKYKCLNRGGFRVETISSSYSLSDVSSLSSCVKMYSIENVPSGFFVSDSSYNSGGIQMRWPDPNCGSCEAKGQSCRFKNYGTNNETECFDVPKTPSERNKEKRKKVTTAFAVVISVITATFIGALSTVYEKKRRKQHKERRIVQFLEDYRALRPTRYTYSEIKRITEGFKYKLGRGGYGTVYKGMLSSEIPVAVKILSNVAKGTGDDFINEVGTIGNIHHVNVVRLIGYCADGYRRALVYEFLENDSLEKYMGNKFGWEKMYRITLGIARGVEYLHQGCNQRILHFDIKPHNILLDQNHNPKVADFGLAKLCSKDKSVITMTAARGTIGYIAPEVFSRNFGRVSYKSDIYSFGMVLLNMVSGRKNFVGHVQDGSQVYFPEWMYSQLEKGEDIAFEIENGSDVNIVKRLIIVGLWCIQWYPVDRPSMKIVLQMLEGENLPIMPPNPFAATNDENEDGNEDKASSGSSFSSG